jgi:hypothetical protein
MLRNPEPAGEPPACRGGSFGAVKLRALSGSFRASPDRDLCPAPEHSGCAISTALCAILELAHVAHARFPTIDAPRTCITDTCHVAHARATTNPARAGVPHASDGTVTALTRDQPRARLPPARDIASARAAEDRSAALRAITGDDALTRSAAIQRAIAAADRGAIDLAYLVVWAGTGITAAFWRGRTGYQLDSVRLGVSSRIEFHVGSRTIDGVGSAIVRSTSEPRAKGRTPASLE